MFRGFKVTRLAAAAFTTPTLPTTATTTATATATVRATATAKRWLGTGHGVRMEEGRVPEKGEVLPVFENAQPTMIRSISGVSLLFGSSMLFTASTVLEHLTLGTGSIPFGLDPTTLQKGIAAVFGLAGVGGGYAGVTFTRKYVSQLAFDPDTDEVLISTHTLLGGVSKPHAFPLESLIVGSRSSADGYESPWLPVKESGSSLFYLLDLDRGHVIDERLMALLLQA